MSVALVLAILPRLGPPSPRSAEVRIHRHVRLKDPFHRGDTDAHMHAGGSRLLVATTPSAQPTMASPCASRQQFPGTAQQTRYA